MPTAKKAAVIDELTEKLGQVCAAALIDYRGLSVAEISDLRTQLRQRDIELQVTKNTLLREAAHRNDMSALDELFSGPTAVAFIYQDESAASKALNTFFRTARVGAIKSGILKGGRQVSAEQFAKLADLPNRQTLLAQIAGLFESPLAQLAALFNAPAQQLAYAIAALEEKGGAAPAAEAPVAQAEAATATEPAQIADQPEATPALDAAAIQEIGVAETEPSAVEIETPAVIETETPAEATVEAEAPAAVETEAPAEFTTTDDVSVDEAAPAEVAAETPAEVTAADASSAPESAGSATEEAAEPAAVTEETTEPAADEVEPAQQAAADTSSAPESEGSADARP